MPFSRRGGRYPHLMGRMTRTAVFAGAAVAGAAVTNRVVTGRGAGARRTRSGTPHVITVYRKVNEVTSLPEPLTELGDAVEIQLREAPGDRGTEITVRAVDPAVSAGAIRRALRDSRSLLEVGEILEPGTSTTEPTLRNRPLRKVTRRGREEGLL
jgi:hypothetical protein